MTMSMVIECNDCREPIVDTKSSYTLRTSAGIVGYVCSECGKQRIEVRSMLEKRAERR